MIDSTCVFYGPDEVEPGPPIEVEREPRVDPPDFRFLYPDPRRRPRRLRIVPFGFGGVGVDLLRRPWRGAVGEVDVVDTDRAIARFAHLDREHLRGAAAALERWAREDRWRLEIDPERRPLAAPGPAHATHGERGRCDRCGAELQTSHATRLGLAARGWEPTRCHLCPGRVRWWTPTT